MTEPLLNRPLSLADEPLDSEHIRACDRVPILDWISLLESCGKRKWVDQWLEKRPFDCCKDLANVDIEAFYSCAAERDKGTPDLYKIHCRECEAMFMRGEIRPRRERVAGFSHVQFCVGASYRPMWEIR